MIWSDRQVTQLHALWRKCDADGKPMFNREQIAEAMGIGLKAVIAKLGREYVAGRLERRKQPSHAVGGAKAVRTAKITSAKISAVRQPIRLPELPPLSRPIVRPRACQWPMWKHGDRSPVPPLFCEARVLRGHAYCPDHCRVAFHNWHELSRVAAGTAGHAGYSQ